MKKRKAVKVKDIPKECTLKGMCDGCEKRNMSPEWDELLKELAKMDGPRASGLKCKEYRYKGKK